MQSPRDGQWGVGDTLLAAPRQTGQEVGHLSGSGLWEVDAEHLALDLSGLAASVQEEQQEGQEKHDGGRKQDAQERLHIRLGGTHLLGALQLVMR